ncbi:hypothetical protein A4X13_0g8167, partial [Tilletia indica]
MNTHKLGSSVDGNDRAMLFFLWDAPLGNYQPQKLGVAETAERLAQYGWEPTTTLISAANAFRMRPFSRNQVFNPHHWQEYRDHLTANLAGQDGAVATLTVPTNGQPQAGPSHLLEPATPLPSIAHEDHSQPQHQPEEVSLVASVSSVTSATPSTVVASGIPTERSSQAAEVDVSDVTMAVADLVLSSPAIEPFESAPDVVKDSTFRASQSELSEVQQGVENAGPCALNSTSSATAESNSPEEGMISHALFQRADRPPCKDKFVREPIELRPRLLPDRTVWVIENPTSDGPLDKMVEYEGVLASNGAVVAGNRRISDVVIWRRRQFDVGAPPAVAMEDVGLYSWRYLDPRTGAYLPEVADSIIERVQTLPLEIVFMILRLVCNSQPAFKNMGKVFPGVLQRERQLQIGPVFFPPAWLRREIGLRQVLPRP